MRVQRSIDSISTVVVIDTCAVWNVLSSTTLHGAVRGAGFDFAITDFVLYECLHKPREQPRDADEQLQKRLRSARDRGEFKSCTLSVEDPQVVASMEERKRLGKGELASIAFARRLGLAFQTDDQGARKIGALMLSFERVQTTPHVLGWFFYTGLLVDRDLTTILEEHEAVGRQLRPYFTAMYEEAMRCRLLTRTATG